MRDFSQRPGFIQTYWQDTPGTATYQASKDLWAIGLGPEGADVMLGSGPGYAEALRAAQEKVKAEYPDRSL